MVLSILVNAISHVFQTIILVYSHPYLGTVVCSIALLVFVQVNVCEIALFTELLVLFGVLTPLVDEGVAELFMLLDYLFWFEQVELVILWHFWFVLLWLMLPEFGYWLFITFTNGASIRITQPFLCPKWTFLFQIDLISGEIGCPSKRIKFRPDLCIELGQLR
jgi:hypothetical protein